MNDAAPRTAPMIDTNSPTLRSWIPVPEGSHFPIQNLPYGVFRPKVGGAPRIGVAIGEHVLDLAAVERAGKLDAALLRAAGVFLEPDLNAFLAAGRPIWSRARQAISRLLSADESSLRDNAALRKQAILLQSDVEMLLPIRVGDYTDFYASRDHAINVGAMIRPDNPLMPNWTWLPVGYHGRSSSVVVSGTPVRRPRGQTKISEEAPPALNATRMLDFELEVGAVIGTGNALGEPVPVDRAMDHVFGFVLLNDWSARDIQRWEYQPLGPFLSKSFATTISPWIVTIDALAPFRAPQQPQEPPPLPYLAAKEPHTFDIRLQIALATEKLSAPHRVSASNFHNLYWSVAQMVAHHTVAGCNLRPGDLLGSGTISGPTPDTFGSMLEIAWRGDRPVELPSGEKRSFLQDGDTVIMTGWCEAEGRRIGFGECRGTVLPAG
jgi:fumarylacetoacetase